MLLSVGALCLESACCWSVGIFQCITMCVVVWLYRTSVCRPLGDFCPVCAFCSVWENHFKYIVVQISQHEVLFFYLSFTFHGSFRDRPSRYRNSQAWTESTLINIYNYRDMLNQASVMVINIKEHNTIYLVIYVQNTIKYSRIPGILI